jgi:hypothetical protein
VAAKTFEEWIHDGLENDHDPTDSHGWLRRAWEAATIAAEERFTSHNKQSAPCPYHRHLFAQYGYDHFCDHPDKCEW